MYLCICMYLLLIASRLGDADKSNVFANREARSNFIIQLRAPRGTRTNPQPDIHYDSCDAFPQDQCHPECDGCCGPTDRECRSCRHVSTFGQCIARCAAHQFPHPTTKICQPCWKTCSECSAPHEWNCTACSVRFSLTDGHCVKKCAKGSYLDEVTRRCRACHASCKTCTKRRNLCTSCKTGFEHQGKRCSASCPRGTYMISAEVGCTFCYEDCTECTGAAKNQCTACEKGKILHRHRCRDACPKRFYFDSERQSCKRCHDSCRTCSGPNNADCLSCKRDYVLRDGECRKKCRDDYDGNYTRDPCALVAKMGWCEMLVFYNLCCYTCSQNQTGEMFIAPNLDLDDDDYGYETYDYD